MLAVSFESDGSFFIFRAKALEPVLIDQLRHFFVMMHISVFTGSSVTSFNLDQLIVWNVGQGQWVTVSKAKTCLHFDMGGERIIWADVLKECGTKQNIGFFSHWDVDHLSFVKKAAQKLEKFCVAAPPSGKSPSPKKSEIFEKLKTCPDIHSIEATQDIAEFHFPRDQFRKYKNLSHRGELKKQIVTSNDESRVFEVEKKLLIPGDSPSRQEIIWRQKILSPEKIMLLVLGHHGSRTSTSRELLIRLSNLKLAISTARFARYGHPHQEVLWRLKKFGVSCLQTEFWGNIKIELSNQSP